jgi:hypothetical protein
MDEPAALERLREILARPDYQVDLNQPWWAQVLQPIWDLLRYLLERLLQSAMEATSGRAGAYGWTVLAVCALLIALVTVYLVRAVRLSVTRDSRLSLASLAERRERSERLWTTAQQVAANGQPDEAVRILYLSALYALDERALLHVESSLTNREHARELDRLHPVVARAFSDVVDHYDRLRYGAEPVSMTTFGELSALVAHSRAASLQGATS